MNHNMTSCIISRRRVQVFCICLSLVLALFSRARAKPTLGFSFSQGFPSFSSLTQQFMEKRYAGQGMKTYSGNRVTNDSLLMIYHHDQTVAVVELGHEKLLLGCELIEILKDEDGVRFLEDLSKMNRPLKISFKEMVKLMNQCEIVDKLKEAGERQSRNHSEKPPGGNNQIFPRSPLSLLSGIIPGTKWCGTGDIATSYNDLGAESVMDRCCRSHDLCPIKVRAYQTRYELHNDSLYTKSHCICDDMLFSCLKKTNTSAAQLMATVYFNIVQVPCLQEGKNGYEYQPAKEFRV